MAHVVPLVAQKGGRAHAEILLQNLSVGPSRSATSYCSVLEKHFLALESLIQWDGGTGEFTEAVVAVD